MKTALAIVLLFSYQALGSQWFPTQMSSAIYPSLAVQARISGAVKLRVTLDSAGRVLRSEVISGNAILSKAAQENVSSWVFVVPCDPRPASDSIEMTYSFSLAGSVESHPRVSFRYEHPYKVFVVSEGLQWEP